MEPVTEEQLKQLEAWIRAANINIDILMAEAQELARQRDEARAEVEALQTLMRAKK